MTKLFALLFLLFPASVFSQGISVTYDVPALTVGPRRSGGDPTITFDKRVLVKIERSPRAAELCLFINTVTGDIGIQYGRPVTLGVCQLNIDDPKFALMLIRSSGQVQTYVTRVRNGAVKHYMMSGNTEVVPVSFPRMENVTLQRLATTDPGYRRGGVASRAYRANSSAPTFFFHGRTEPPNLTVQNFLGYSGIGYAKTNRGIFMAVRADMGSTEYQAFTWQDVPTRLNPDLFESVETMMDERIADGMDREEEKLRNQSFSGDCAMEQQELNRLKLADVEARRRTNSTRNSGNVYESESSRRALGSMMTPNLEIMHQEIEVSACKANARLSNTRSDTQRAEIERKIACYRQSQRDVSAIQAEWDAIDARYPNEAGRAYAEKSRTFGRLSSIGSSCR